MPKIVNTNGENGRKTISSSSTYSCTACNKAIKSTYEASIHPLIDCLICRECYKVYGTGDFETAWEDGVDENGDDNYCRWCCDGGDLFGCMTGADSELNSKSRCHYSFCRDCIKRNVPLDPILTVDQVNDNDQFKWFCYACDKSKIAKLIKEAQAAIHELSSREQRKNESNVENSAKKQKTQHPTNNNGFSNDDPKPVQATSAAATPTTTINTTVASTTSSTITASTTSISATASTSNTSASTINSTASTTNTATNCNLNNNISSKQPTEAQEIFTPLPAPSARSMKATSSSSSSKHLNKSNFGPTPSKTIPNGQYTSRTPTSTPVSADKSSSLYKSMTLAKQREVSHITASLAPREIHNVRLNESDIKSRLDSYGKTKQLCIDEIGIRFSSICEMFLSKEVKKKQLISIEIDNLRRPMQEFELMLSDLKKLHSSL